MNVFGKSRISGLFISLCLSAISGATNATSISAPTTRPTGEPVAELAVGRTEGSFPLVFHGDAQLAMPGHCALVVSIQDGAFRESGKINLDDAKGFVFEEDLAPGDYYLTVSPADLNDADYWPSIRQQIYIDKQGRLYQMRDAWSKPGPFVLDRRMKGISPAPGGIADTQPPVLKWPAIAGATHYRGDYFGDDGQNWFDVDEPQFVIGAGIPGGGGCMWRVNALDANGKLLARGEGHFFGHGTDKQTIEKLHEAGGSCAVDSRSGVSYLGIQPLPAQVPKDPQTPTEENEAGGTTVQDAASGFLPGIMVARILPGSPAIDAGLIPDDIIIAVNGQRVRSDFNLGDYRAFSEQIAAMKPGTRISLTVRRFPHELTLSAVIGKYPGATTQPAPATSVVETAEQPGNAPVAPNGKPAPDETGITVSWSDADPGTPAVSLFKAKPRGEVPHLTSNEGLAADFITSVVELSKGGMAFGTQSGLSIWDGAEIRTYTGPATSRESFVGVTPANSGLPGDSVEDLLCDSRGRLWVATHLGVCRMQIAKGGRWRVLSNPNRGPSSRRGMDATADVMKMFEASDGTIVLGTRKSAIMLVDPKTDAIRLIHLDNDENHWITAIAEDTRHRLWFSVHGVGVLRYDGTQIEEIKGNWIKSAAAYGLAIDGAGTVWINNGPDGLGALHADGTTETVGPEMLPGDFVEHVTTDRQGRLWATSAEGFAVRIADAAQKGKETWQYSDVKQSNGADFILNTSDDSWWIIGSGATRRTEMKLTSRNPRQTAIDQLKDEVQKAYPAVKPERRRLIAAKGIVIGVADRRPLRFDGNKWEDLTAKVGRVDVYDLFADSKGTLWIATGGQGLIGVDPNGSMRRFNNQPDLALSVIYCVAETPDGTLYAGTQHGVYRLRGATWEQVESDLFQVGQMLVDRCGRVWMLEITFSKLYVYDGKFFHEVKEQTAISKDPIIQGTLRLGGAGDVLVDIPARPGDKLPKRTCKWDAMVEGRIGPPTIVKADSEKELTQNVRIKGDAKSCANVDRITISFLPGSALSPTNSLPTRGATAFQNGLVTVNIPSAAVGAAALIAIAFTCRACTPCTCNPFRALRNLRTRAAGIVACVTQAVANLSNALQGLVGKSVPAKGATFQFPGPSPENGAGD